MRRGTGTQALLYDCPACNSRFGSSRLGEFGDRGSYRHKSAMRAGC